MYTDINVKNIIYRLVVDFAKRREGPLRVKNILATFNHPEVADLRIEALLWFNHNQCHPEDIIMAVERDLAKYLVVSQPQLGQETFKALV